MLYIIGLIGILMIIGAIAVLFVKNLRDAVIIMGVVSLIAALVFVLLKAYDVAITEASIGAVLTTALYFWALKRLEEETPPNLED